MASGTMPDFDFYPTSPQPHARSNAELDQAGADSHDSFGAEQGLHGSAEPLDNNSRATLTNGFEVSPTLPRSRSPDEFYKGFGESSHNAHGAEQTESSKHSTAQHQPSSATRSTSSSAALKYPSIAQSRSQPPKPSHRSASAPVVERAVPRVGRSAAVQERIKMFDQKSGQASSIHRGTSNSGSPRSPYLTSPSSSSGSRTTRPGQATREPSSGRVTSPQLSRTQRPRFTVEDQYSSNAVASAARPSKQRSASNALDEATWGGNMASLGTSATSRPPLFGEIVTSESGSQIPYGISDRGRTRRSVESTISARPRETSESHGQESAPGSFTEEWYRSGASESTDSNSPDFPGQHARSMSDSCAQPTQPQGLSGAIESAKDHAEQKVQSKSRLPVMSKATASSSTSRGASTVRTSSAMSKRTASDGKEYQASANRPYSPTGHVGYNGRGTRTQPRNLGKTPANIQAMITPVSAPLKSPPLRSSKIRLPVSSASTASSRNKVADKVGPGRSRAASRVSNGDERSPGVSNFIGKPDFAARRARIQEGMHKRAEEIKEKEQQAHERAEMEEAAERLHENLNDEVPEESPEIADFELEAVANRQLNSAAEESPILPHNEHSPPHARSPALGMPGSFPISQPVSADSPLSAVSTASIETLFDNELQTEPPTQQELTQDEAKRPSATSMDYPPHPTLAHKNDVIDFSQRLAEAKIDLTGDPDESHHYSEAESRVFSVNQPRSHDIMLGDHSEERVDPSMILTDFSADMSHRRSPVIAQDFFRPISSMDGSSENRPIRAFSDTRPSEAGDTTANNEVMEHSSRPSWQLHTTSPPRSSTSRLPKLQTSSSYTKLLNLTSRDVVMSSDKDGACSESSSDSPQLSVEGYLKSKRTIPSQDDAYDRRSHSVDSAFEVGYGTPWSEYRITEAEIDAVVRGGPPPPPKEPLQDQGPAVPPKSNGYTPLLTPRPHGDYPGPAKPYPSSYEFPSFRARSAEAAHQTGSFERPSASSGPVSANPSIHSNDQSNKTVVPNNGLSTNLWEPTPSLSSRPYFSSDSNVGREAGGDNGACRPSTSTRRSSAFISNGSDNAETPVSGNDQPDRPGSPHPDCPVRPPEFARIIQRKNHLIELVDTEAAFNKDMNVLVEIYQGTAVAVPDLKPDDIRVIFRNANQIIEVSQDFLTDLKETTMPVYIHRSAKAKARTGESKQIGEQTAAKLYITLSSLEIIETRVNDLKTAVGEVFLKHIPTMLEAYTKFINGSSAANCRIQILQEQHPSVKVWLEECNAAAADLSAAWDLGSMLVKPMQRITKYPMMIQDLIRKTPDGDKDPLNANPMLCAHPDRKALEEAYKQMDIIVRKINADTARVEIVHGALSDSAKKKDAPPSTNVIRSILGREKKTELSSLERANEDTTYLFCVDRYHSEFARIEIIIRDIQKYIEKVMKQTNDFLQLLSASELVARTPPSSYPEIESKWARFNLSMRDLRGLMDEHVEFVTTHFLVPFKRLAGAYRAVQPAINLRNKRRPKFFEYEKGLELLKEKDKSGRAKLDEKLLKMAREYTALNDALTLDLPRLSELNEHLKNACLGGFVYTQCIWWGAWTERLRTVLKPEDMTSYTTGMIEKYYADSSPAVERAEKMRLIDGSLLADARAGRNSEHTLRDDESAMKAKSRTSTINERSRGYSVNSDHPPSAFLSPALRPTASEQSPSFSTANSSGWSLAHPNKKDAAQANHAMDGAGSYDAARTSHSYRSVVESRRTSTDSRQPRPSVDSYSITLSNGARPPTSNTQINPGGWVDGLPPQEPAFSDVFESALPWSNSEEDAGPDEFVIGDNVDTHYTVEQRGVHRNGRPNQYLRPVDTVPSGPKALYIVASLEAFHIDGTKTEGNYPYLTYGEGEIFDVVAEKGELWLARNQDDPEKNLGWIWNQHFMRIESA